MMSSASQWCGTHLRCAMTVNGARHSSSTTSVVKSCTLFFSFYTRAHPQFLTLCVTRLYIPDELIRHDTLSPPPTHTGRIRARSPPFTWLLLLSLRDITASDLGGGGEAVRYAARERGSAFYYIYMCVCVRERERVCGIYMKTAHREDSSAMTLLMNVHKALVRP